MIAKTARAKLSDVWWMTVNLLPVTRCEPPEGQTCSLQGGTTNATATDAKRHAFDHPGHLVTREAVARTQYHLDPDEPAGEVAS